MMPGPGRGWALVMWDQEAILWTPEEYCRVTVFPIKSDRQHLEKSELTDIGELPVFEDYKVHLFAQLLELLCKVEGEVLDDIAVCLSSAWQTWKSESEHTLIIQTLGPTALTISRTSLVVVTSTDTHKLVCFRSINSSNRFAVGLACELARSA